MVQNKKNKLNLKFFFKRIEYKLFITSLIFFLIIKILLTILYLILKLNVTLYIGLFLGYLFSLIGFLIICFSWWLLSISLNKYFFILLYIIRLIIYSIPLIICFKNDILFNILIIIGISLCPLSSLFLNIKLSKLFVNNNKEREKNDN